MKIVYFKISKYIPKNKSRRINENTYFWKSVDLRGFNVLTEKCRSIWVFWPKSARSVATEHRRCDQAINKSDQTKKKPHRFPYIIRAYILVDKSTRSNGDLPKFMPTGGCPDWLTKVVMYTPTHQVLLPDGVYTLLGPVPVEALSSNNRLLMRTHPSPLTISKPPPSI